MSNTFDRAPKLNNPVTKIAILSVLFLLAGCATAEDGDTETPGVEDLEGDTFPENESLVIQEDASWLRNETEIGTYNTVSSIIDSENERIELFDTESYENYENNRFHIVRVDTNNDGFGDTDFIVDNITTSYYTTEDNHHVAVGIFNNENTHAPSELGNDENIIGEDKRTTYNFISTATLPTILLGENDNKYATVTGYIQPEKTLAMFSNDDQITYVKTDNEYLYSNQNEILEENLENLDVDLPMPPHAYQLDIHSPVSFLKKGDDETFVTNGKNSSDTTTYSGDWHAFAEFDHDELEPNSGIHLTQDLITRNTGEGIYVANAGSSSERDYVNNINPALQFEPRWYLVQETDGAGIISYRLATEAEQEDFTLDVEKLMSGQ